MVDFLKKRLQVFVSSTFTDLRQERQAAVEAILSAGHIPAGMELFAAGDESQMEVIKQWIDESDVYMLILGGRYGSVESKSGKSYTQVEYEYAIEKGKPFFACVMTETALDARVHRDGKSVLELDNPQQLKAFRAQVLGKISKLCDDCKDIKIAIVETLAHFARQEDLSGWVRQDAGVNLPALADEVTRLSKENAVLRSKVSYEASEGVFNGLSFSEIKELLQHDGVWDFMVANFKTLSRGYVARKKMTRAGELALERLVDLKLMYQPTIGQYAPNSLGDLFFKKLEIDTLRSKR